jgi:two-component system response regulator QseB
MHLLLIEDDLDLGADMQRALVTHGFTSEWVRTLKDARTRLEPGPHGLHVCAVLDLGMPDGSGLDLVREWRGSGRTLPVIVLTARDALASRVACLDAGADDYVIKPVAAEELASRIRAVTRRAAGYASAVWSVGRLQIDLSRHEVRHEGSAVALSPREFRIVAELARHAGTVVPKHRVARAVAPLGDPMEFSALEWHVHNLRRKLGGDSIHTVRGVGYRLGA